MVQGQKRDQPLREDGTMFAALHSELVVHPWPEPGAPGSDADSLLYVWPSAVEWLTDAAD